MPKKLSPDKVLFGVVIILVLFGIGIVYSASAAIALELFHSTSYFLIKQIISMAIGLLLMMLLLNIDYRIFKKSYIVYTLLAFSVGMLAYLVAVSPSLGFNRWFRWGAISFQPSELAKLCLVIFLAFYLDRNREKLNHAYKTILPLLAVVGTLAILIMRQPDLGTAIFVVLIAVVMMFIAGVNWKYLGGIFLSASLVFYWLIVRVPYRWQRLMAFVNPWKDPLGYGFQPIQSLIAISTGGVTGMGVGQSKQKLFYLPAPHTDFIYSVIGEELGLIGASVVVVAFGILMARGIKAAVKAPDHFGTLLAAGLTLMIIFQALINISVALTLLPTKGLPLPFISYGGSALIVSLMAVGILLNISQYSS